MQQQFFISIDLRKIIKIPFFHSIQSHKYTAVKAEYFGRKRVSNFKSLIGLPFSQEQVIIRSVFKKFISRQKNRYIQIEAYAKKQIYATKKRFFPSWTGDSDKNYLWHYITFLHFNYYWMFHYDRNKIWNELVYLYHINDISFDINELFIRSVLLTFVTLITRVYIICTRSLYKTPKKGAETIITVNSLQTNCSIMHLTTDSCICLSRSFKYKFKLFPKI